MKVGNFFKLFNSSLSEQKFEIYLNKDFVCCGYISDIPDEKKDKLLNAKITRFYPVTSNCILFDAEICPKNESVKNGEDKDFVFVGNFEQGGYVCPECGHCNNPYRFRGTCKHCGFTSSHSEKYR